MGKPTGFLEVERADRGYDKPAARKKSWKEFVKPLPEPVLRAQASRCMDCGIPFCHEGCPVNNLIPDWNNLVYRDQWRQALVTLHSTNNFPEFTGRICPAPCETSCKLNIDDNPVTIRRSNAPSSTAAGRRAGYSRRRRRAAPGNASRSSGPGRPAWPAPSNWRAPGIL